MVRKDVIFFISIIIASLICGNVFAQALYTISGIVSGDYRDAVTLDLYVESNICGAGESFVSSFVTGTDGLWYFSSLENGNYKLYPSKEGIVFCPGVLAITINGADVTDQEFLSHLPEETDPRGLGLDMVPLSGSTFWMGGPDGVGEWDEQPRHQVTLSSFKITKHEITNAQFVQFLNAKGKHVGSDGKQWYWPDKGHIKGNGTYVVDSGYENHPVVEVSWYGAVAFCSWACGRLPTEAEWEYTARGGLDRMTFPWGHNNPDCNKANFYNNSDFCVGDTAPVGSYPPNGYGIYDMAGNVYEWCSDWHNDNYYRLSPSTDPQGPPSGERRVIRGGAYNDYLNSMRCSRRDMFDPEKGNYVLGFRMVQD